MRKNIQLLRRTLGLTQKEFGFNLGCSRDKIANIELGRVVPDDVFIRHICTVFKVNEKWLRDGTGEMWIDDSSTSNIDTEEYGALPVQTKMLVDHILHLSPDDLQKLETVLSLLFPQTDSTVNN